MLKQLTVNNYILIKSIELIPSSNLNIITGETGAGKSILIGAINLLMGHRYNGKKFFDETKKCIIEATFNIKNYKLNKVFEKYELDYDDELLVRREININGKSRAFINDTPVNLLTLKAILSFLIDIHSQFDNLLLENINFKLNIIDSFAQNTEIKNQYLKSYKLYTDLKKEYENKALEIKHKQEKLDYNEYLLKELKSIDLKAINQQNLEDELKTLDNSEFLKDSLYQSLNILDLNHDSINNKYSEVIRTFSKLKDVSAIFQSIYTRLESNFIELKDIINEIVVEENKIEINPEKLELVKNKLDQLLTLQNKHKVSNTSELIEIEDKLEKEIFEIKNSHFLFTEILERLEDQKKEVILFSKKLSETRKEASKILKAKIIELLKDLGMENASLEIDFKEVVHNKTGIDEALFLFNANKGVKLQPIEETLSGGEISRLMFCLKYIISGKTSLPTIIFDEIDTGISGEISIKMAKMMQKMASSHQILVITHQPQIAVAGDKHFLIEKKHYSNITHTEIKDLSLEDRKKEIAKMIAGENFSFGAIKTVEEMLENK